MAKLPDVPTSLELGWPDMERITGWTALMGPPGLPKDVVERWVDALYEGLATRLGIRH